MYLAFTSSDPCIPTNARMASAITTAANNNAFADNVPVYFPFTSILFTSTEYFIECSSLFRLICIITNFETMYTIMSAITISRITGSSPAKYALFT